MGIRSRLVAATMAVATLTAVVGVTAASASPAPSVSSSASTPAKPGTPGKPGKPGGVNSATLAKVAASLHVTVKQLTTALVNFKLALGRGASKQAALAGFAKELGVSVAKATQALQALSGGQSGVPAAAIQLLAGKLHISADRARTVYADLAKLSAKSGDITADPGFVAIAKSLGITPQRLQSVLIEVKQELAGKSAPGGSPTK
jgi:hypothetical protein